MTNSIDGNMIRQILLEVVDELSRKQKNFLQSGAILQETSQRLRAQNKPVSDQGLLTLFYDLFRNGHLSWGCNLSNANPPWCHVTEQGRETLRHLSRDPANPDGYRAHLSGYAILNPIADSYLEEALKTYNTGCFKSSAVMLGTASESIVLELRDVLVKRITDIGRAPARGLRDWRIKAVLDALKANIDPQKGSMPNTLKEAFEANWPSFTHQIRVARNDSGHPTSIDPVTLETVHASLLIFPELVKLASELSGWISRHYI